MYNETGAGMNPTVAQIRAEFADAEGWPKTTPLPRAQTLAWMHSEDPEVLGAIHRLLRYKGGLARVQPPLERADYHEFMTRYLRRCLCEYTEEPLDAGSEREEAEGGFAATHEAVYWFLDLWREKTTSRSALEEIKALFAEVLRDCAPVRGLLATALYDHLLSRRSVRKFFADWQTDPQLRRFLK